MSTPAETGGAPELSGSVLVLGSGFVGTLIAQMAGRDGDVSLLSRSTHPQLAAPGPEARDLIRSEVARLGARSVVNCVGLLRGTPEEMVAANTTWPAWLSQDVLHGTGSRLVHLGSAAEYGDPGGAEPISEQAPPRPSGSYGETKWSGSAAVLDARRSGLDAVVARGFNFVGPHLPAVSPLHQFVTDVSALGPDGGRVEVWWPDTIRDFILLTDLARAMVALARVDEVPDLVNLCSGIGVSFGDAVRAIAARQAKCVEIVSLERPGIPVVIGDNRRMVSLCGFVPAMSAELLAAHAAVEGAI